VFSPQRFSFTGSPLYPYNGFKPRCGTQRATFRVRFLTYCALALCSLATSLPAHEVQRNCSFTVVDTAENKLQWTITFNLYDLNRFFKLDTNANHFLSFDEIRAALPRMTQELRDNLKLAIDGKPVVLKDYPDLFNNTHRELIMQNAYVAATLAFAGEGHYTEADALMAQLNFVFGIDISEKPKEIFFDTSYFYTLDQEHRHIAIIDFRGKDPLIFDKTTPQQGFVRSSDGTYAKSGGSSSVYFRFLKYGIEHILIGYDHILFLLGLLIVSLNLKELVKIVTSFTIAHSITLTLAALNIVQLPSRLIETAIALTIVYVAVENFFIKSSKHRWKLTFGFGLIHGFGFANVLQELGLPGEGLVVALFNFNLGVEIGQLFIVLVTAPIFLLFSKSAHYPKFVKIASGIIGLFGLIWFIQRATGYTIIPI
jgi:hypothetical protein